MIFPHILFNLACFKATKERELHSKYQAFIMGNLKKKSKKNAKKLSKWVKVEAKISGMEKK